MTSLLRVKMRWTGFVGGPGYSVFHFRDFSAGPPVTADAVAATRRIETFETAVLGLLPQNVQLQVASDVEEIEDTTGELLNVFNGSPVAAKFGTSASTANYAAAVGMNITWRTGGIRNGRRIKGRTFMVPLTSGAFSPDGTPSAASITTLSTAANELINAAGSPDLFVWSRPSGPGAADGVSYAATGYSIPDMSTVLRSRR